MASSNLPPYITLASSQSSGKVVAGTPKNKVSMVSAGAKFCSNAGGPAHGVQRDGIGQVITDAAGNKQNSAKSYKISSNF